MSIKTVLKAVTGTAIALATFSTLPANAASQYDSLFVFGDSTSDTGNSLNLTGFPPEPFYTNGRFSNGSVWVDYLGESLGLNPTLFTTLPSNGSIPSQGINFATGGAKTGRDNIADQFFPDVDSPGLAEQIDEYTNLLGGRSADPDALYTVFAGGNDYIDLLSSPVTPDEIPAQISQTVGNLSNALATLAQSGARNIVIANLPNLGDLPVGSSQQALLNQLTSNHNALLAQSIAGLEQQFSGTNFIRLDVNSLFQNVRNDPARFGFSNATDNCTNFDFPIIDSADLAGLRNCNTALANDPKAFVFWDNQHPTTEGHRLIANAALDSLGVKSVPEPSLISALGLLGLLAIGGALQRNNL
ncbi:MAG: SGNH/GDSL hydrolase family protein [Hydrococcus sp. Prado102]|jgi:phospholipase/lecithinase/hemolysin|nr:SGNH/GDSL hydrolase family protein [Hydrococcus sp. Prado102]